MPQDLQNGAGTLMPMDTLLSRLAAISVRELVPRLLHEGISYGFDDRTGGWHVAGPAGGLEGSFSEVRALNCSLHRLGLAAIDNLAGGGVLGFEAQAEAEPGGGCRLHWRLSGQPERRGGLGFLQAAERLQLRPQAEGSAQGLCPASQAAVTLAWRRTGFELHGHYLLRRAWRRPAPPRPTFGSRHLWLVQPDAVLAASVARQASQEGWTVAILHGCEAALQRLRQPAPGEVLPALLVVFAHAAMAPATLQRLRRGLPRGVHAVLAVETGSLWLGHADTVPGYELCCHPFSQRDWQAWERLLRQPPPEAPQPGSDAASPLKVLVAQHDDVARCLTQSVLQAAGYEVHAARDMLQALDACLRLAPTVMLLDPALAGPPGEQLPRRLHRLQRAGLAPPCRIVLHGPGVDAAQAWQALADGVDGFVPQPVDLHALRSEMRRWCVAHGA